jgi:GxxExxY protein
MNDGLTEKIIGAAIEVHRILGPGLLETIYQQALCHELERREIPFETQKEITIDYKGLPLRGQRLDLLINEEVVVELKSVTRLPEVAVAQTLSYLKASSLRRALLINFGSKRLVDGIKRISL